MNPLPRLPLCFIVFFSLLLWLNQAIACGFDSNCAHDPQCIIDYQECGFDNPYRKPPGLIGAEGYWMSPVDLYTNHYDKINSPPAYLPSDCQYSSDCELGFYCRKRPGDVYGICLKAKTSMKQEEFIMPKEIWK